MKKYLKLALAILVLGLSVAIFFILRREKCNASFYGNDSVWAVVDFGSYSDAEEEMFGPGYDYELLKMMASDFGSNVEISFGKPGESWIDSLEQGVVDIVALPSGLGIESRDSVHISKVVDDFSVWLVRNKKNLKEVNSWIGEYNLSERQDSVRARFLTPFEPFWDVRNGVTRAVLSPYDDLIKEYAEEIDWDWLLLASVIFQESRFRIEARSGKDAEGLMQMIPATSGRYDVDNLFDPEQNIKAGVSHIRRLQRMFSGCAKNKVELRKMALAAYNAGEGHIQDCINLARVNQMEYGTWEDLCVILPEFQNPEISQVDTVKCGPFKSAETVKYIKRIYDIYWAFQKIYSPTQPALSEQDQPLR